MVCEMGRWFFAYALSPLSESMDHIQIYEYMDNNMLRFSNTIRST